MKFRWPFVWRKKYEALEIELAECARHNAVLQRQAYSAFDDASKAITEAMGKEYWNEEVNHALTAVVSRWADEFRREAMEAYPEMWDPEQAVQRLKYELEEKNRPTMRFIHPGELRAEEAVLTVVEFSVPSSHYRIKVSEFF